MQNYHLHQAKEALDVLDRVVRQEEIQHIVFAGDQVVIALLQKKLSPFLAAKVIDILRLDIRTPERQVLEATLAAMRRQDAKDDSEKVARLIGDHLSGGLAVVGVPDVLAALSKGQVDEVLLSASSTGDIGEAPETILAQARQTGAGSAPVCDIGAERSNPGGC
jgi:hypothetical protein